MPEKKFLIPEGSFSWHLAEMYQRHVPAGEISNGEIACSALIREKMDEPSFVKEVLDELLPDEK